MNNIRSGLSRLDSIRLNEGADRCKDVFDEICKKDKATAVALINDRRLTFPCLFTLMPQIESFHLYRRISPIKKTAFWITAQIIKPGTSGNARYLTEKNSAEYSALKWILETGKLEDGNEYENVLDVAVSVLINMYKDKTILPSVSDMIFMRESKGRNIHDLVWAFFRISDPYALKLIAQHILSPRDSELALSLLDIKSDRFGADSEKQAFLQWLDENDPFLYFTDESFQLTSRPVFYRIDLERKYVQKSTASHMKQQIVPSDIHENRCLEAFRSLENEEKRILSEYSHKIHNDLSKWKMWMALPVDEQIKAATQNCGDI